MAQILVLYDSRGGLTEQLAESIGEGVLRGLFRPWLAGFTGDAAARVLLARELAWEDADRLRSRKGDRSGAEPVPPFCPVVPLAGRDCAPGDATAPLLPEEGRLREVGTEALRLGGRCVPPVLPGVAGRELTCRLSSRTDDMT